MIFGIKHYCFDHIDIEWNGGALVHIYNIRVYSALNADRNEAIQIAI